MTRDADWDLLRRLVHKALRVLERKDIAHAEAFFTSTATTEVTIRNSAILTQNRIDDSGVGFRVAAAHNHVGFACTNTLSEKAILAAGERAFAMARVSSEVPHFALPQASCPPEVTGLFDPRVAEMTVEEAVELAGRAIRAAEAYDKRVIAKDGRVSLASGWRGVVNTLGVDCEEQETKAVIYLAGSGKHNGAVTGSCYDYMFNRTADLKPESVGEGVGKKVIRMFQPKPLKRFQGPVIFGPEAVSYQLVDVLIDALRGDNVVAQRSAWTGQLEERVASETLTLTDNPVLADGFASRRFDDEGCASQHTVLVSKGTLESCLHDATSANALKRVNTGNASRFPSGFDMIRAIVGHGYRAKPVIYPSNLTIQPGNQTTETLVSEIAQGVLVEAMAGFAQAGSGLISAQLSRAFFIDHGEIAYPIKGAMLSGVAFDWFNQISGVGKEPETFPNAVVPSLRINDVRVIGA